MGRGDRLDLEAMLVSERRKLGCTEAELAVICVLRYYSHLGAEPPAVSAENELQLPD